MNIVERLKKKRDDLLNRFCEGRLKPRLIIYKKNGHFVQVFLPSPISDKVHYEFYESEGKGVFDIHLECNNNKSWTEDFRRELLDALEKRDDLEVLPKNDGWHWFRVKNENNNIEPIVPSDDDETIINKVVAGFEEIIRTFEPIILNYRKTQMDKDMEIMEALLKMKRNLILTGAPGVGKTYTTAELALRILGKTADWSKHEAVMEEYNKLLPMIKGEDGKTYVENKEAQIFFTTFHQSLDYEDFVEGLKPELVGDNITYKVEDGIFKLACNAAKDKPVVLIIDEINRGNVSKIFGELITLVESDKRQGGKHPLSAILPYSKSQFSVPSNLYIIGTMNTTDRSTGTLDYALRRRFAFFTLSASEEAIKDYYGDKESLKDKALELFGTIKEFIKPNGDYSLDDLMVGHSYFMAGTIEELRDKLEYEIIPLIKEYRNDGILNVSDDDWDTATKNWREQLKGQEQLEQ